MKLYLLGASIKQYILMIYLVLVVIELSARIQVKSISIHCGELWDHNPKLCVDYLFRVPKSRHAKQLLYSLVYPTL